MQTFFKIPFSCLSLSLSLSLSLLHYYVREWTVFFIYGQADKSMVARTHSLSLSRIHTHTSIFHFLSSSSSSSFFVSRFPFHAFSLSRAHARAFNSGKKIGETKKNKKCSSQRFETSSCNIDRKSVV